ncbi:MAG TPA: hypothetical protein VMW94_03945 [Actinomycetes bacterium]|nr:hypothetical protein [Actinomycetes bacterium]
MIMLPVADQPPCTLLAGVAGGGVASVVGDGVAGSDAAGLGGGIGVAVVAGDAVGGVGVAGLAADVQAAATNRATMIAVPSRTCGELIPPPAASQL